MTSKSPTTVFFGNERLATGVTTTAPTLQALIGAGFNVAAVIVNNENTISRKGRDLEIEAVANMHNIPVHAPKKPLDIVDTLEALRADIGVLAAYGKIVPQRIIDIFPYGIINIHPSKLPLHRGPTPIESVILDGSKSTAVSIMQLANEMDAGPILAYAEVPLAGDETKQALADQLLDIGSKLILHTLTDIFNGDITGLPQDESRATYDKLIQKEDGIIDAHKGSLRLEREIRAFAGWPKSRTKINTIEAVVTKARRTDETGPIGEIKITKNELLIHTSDGSLSIEELIPAGRKNMHIKAFLAGYRNLLSSTE